MDTIYDSLIRQIAGERLAVSPGEDIRDAVSRDERRRKLEREIAIPEKKMRAEKQFNRQVVLYGELGKLRREMEGMKLWKFAESLYSDKEDMLTKGDGV
jgi:uncharacterized protein YeeX (DUF496 family)